MKLFDILPSMQLMYIQAVVHKFHKKKLKNKDF